MVQEIHTNPISVLLSSLNNIDIHKLTNEDIADLISGCRTLYDALQKLKKVKETTGSNGEFIILLENVLGYDPTTAAKFLRDAALRISVTPERSSLKPNGPSQTSFSKKNAPAGSLKSSSKEDHAYTNVFDELNMAIRARATLQNAEDEDKLSDKPGTDSSNDTLFLACNKNDNNNNQENDLCVLAITERNEKLEIPIKNGLIKEELLRSDSPKGPSHSRNPTSHLLKPMHGTGGSSIHQKPPVKPKPLFLLRKPLITLEKGQPNQPSTVPCPKPQRKLVNVDPGSSRSLHTNQSAHNYSKIESDAVPKQVTQLKRGELLAEIRGFKKMELKKVETNENNSQDSKQISTGGEANEIESQIKTAIEARFVYLHDYKDDEDDDEWDA